MGFEYKRHLMQGNHPQVISVPQAAVAVTSEQLIMISAGYATPATSGNVSANLLGIAMETYDNSGGDAGDHDLKILVIDEWTVITGAVSGTDSAQANCYVTRYDIEDTNHTVNFDDTTGGFLIPIIVPDSITDGYCDFVVDKAALFNS